MRKTYTSLIALFVMFCAFIFSQTIKPVSAATVDQSVNVKISSEKTHANPAQSSPVVPVSRLEIFGISKNAPVSIKTNKRIFQDIKSLQSFDRACPRFVKKE